MVQRVPREPPETRARQVRPDQKDRLDNLEPQEIKVHPVVQEKAADQAMPAKLATRAHRDQLDHR
jgi:hypothetical protein